MLNCSLVCPSLASQADILSALFQQDVEGNDHAPGAAAPVPGHGGCHGQG